MDKIIRDNIIQIVNSEDISTFQVNNVNGFRTLLKLNKGFFRGKKDGDGLAKMVDNLVEYKGITPTGIELPEEQLFNLEMLCMPDIGEQTALTVFGTAVLFGMKYGENMELPRRNRLSTGSFSPVRAVNKRPIVIGNIGDIDRKLNATSQITPRDLLLDKDLSILSIANDIAIQINTTGEDLKRNAQLVDGAKEVFGDLELSLRLVVNNPKQVETIIKEPGLLKYIGSLNVSDSNLPRKTLEEILQVMSKENYALPITINNKNLEQDVEEVLGQLKSETGEEGDVFDKLAWAYKNIG